MWILPMCGSKWGVMERHLQIMKRDADLKKREKIQKWRTALTETSNLSGWHLRDNQ
ncbi:hypothetical protein CK203_109621 [Vitis vinifera]|uniref:Uncharacterized protein n=1 Tax=Vitis vinifera TaxID=29760 RepID=A0A438CCE5_VITVI|nr:hypothetical protein CK203_109621 [Vitis vinifera]